MIVEQESEVINKIVRIAVLDCVVWTVYLDTRSHHLASPVPALYSTIYFIPYDQI